jgi:hypothetical protein
MKCHCLIYHPKTKKEREKVSDNLRYFRSIKDSYGTLLALAQLTGSCKAMEKTNVKS